VEITRRRLREIARRKRAPLIFVVTSTTRYNRTKLQHYYRDHPLVLASEEMVEAENLLRLRLVVPSGSTHRTGLTLLSRRLE